MFGRNANPDRDGIYTPEHRHLAHNLGVLPENLASYAADENRRADLRSAAYHEVKAINDAHDGGRLCGVSGCRVCFPDEN